MSAIFAVGIVIVVGVVIGIVNEFSEQRRLGKMAADVKQRRRVA